MPASYEFVVEDILAQQVRGDLPLVGATPDEYLRRPGSLSGRLALADADDRLDLLLPAQRAVYVKRNNAILWGGIMWAASVPLGAETVSVDCEGWSGYFDHREIRKDRQFTDVDQFTIFKTLVDDAQDPGLVENGAGADVGIDVVWDALSGVLRTRANEYRYWKGQNLGRALRDLAALDDGFDFAMEYAVTGDQITKELRLFYPSKGNDWTDRPGFEYERGRPTNILRRGVERDASRMAWRFRGWGSGTDAARLKSDVVNEFRRNEFPFLDGSANYSSTVETQTPLDEMTAADAAMVDHVAVLPLTTVDPDLDPKWGSYGLGDSWRVDIDDGFASLSGAFQLIGWRFDLDADLPTLIWQEDTADPDTRPAGEVPLPQSKADAEWRQSIERRLSEVEAIST